MRPHQSEYASMTDGLNDPDWLARVTASERPNWLLRLCVAIPTVGAVTLILAKLLAH
jgi:hypothetical protein